MVRTRGVGTPLTCSFRSHPPSLRTSPEVSPRAPKSRNPHRRIQKQCPQFGAPLNSGYEFKELPASSGVGTDKRARGTGKGSRPCRGSSPVLAALLLHHTDWGGRRAEPPKAGGGPGQTDPQRVSRVGRVPTLSRSPPAQIPDGPGRGFREGVSIVPGAGAWLPNKGPAPPPRPALPRPRRTQPEGDRGAPARPGSRGKPGVSASARGEGKGR